MPILSEHETILSELGKRMNMAIIGSSPESDCFAYPDWENIEKSSVGFRQASNTLSIICTHIQYGVSPVVYFVCCSILGGFDLIPDENKWNETRYASIVNFVNNFEIDLGLGLEYHFNGVFEGNVREQE